MPESKKQPDAAPAKRGEAAWKAELERIAQRNAQASKRGKEERETREKAAMKVERERELRVDAGLNTEFHTG